MSKELTTTQYGQRALVQQIIVHLAVGGWRLHSLYVSDTGRTYKAFKYRRYQFAFNRLIDSGEICLRFERGTTGAWLKLMDNEQPIHDHSTTPGFCRIVERFKLR